MKKQNVINATITLTEAGLKRMQKTPVLKSMLHNVSDLKVGENNISVSHTQHGRLKRMFGIGDAHVIYRDSV